MLVPGLQSLGAKASPAQCAGLRRWRRGPAGRGDMACKAGLAAGPISLRRRVCQGGVCTAAAIQPEESRTVRYWPARPGLASALAKTGAGAGYVNENQRR